jgi:hypothetical protein
MALEVPPKPAAGAEDAGLRLTRLPLPEAAALFARFRARHTTVDAIRADLAAGAPANPDGTLNLIHYAAWLARELAKRNAHRA